MSKFGLIGRSLKHSFSKNYFEKKFVELKLKNHTYDLIEKENLINIKSFLIENNYSGLNITIPYKKEIISQLDSFSDEAKLIGAVNTIKIEGSNLKGYNTDYYGFRDSLLNFIPHNKIKALVFGTGGASKAITKVLGDLNINFKIVSRNSIKNGFTYKDITSEVISNYKLLINTTPLGTFPNVNECINISFEFLSSTHYCYDLIYNPEETLLLKNAKERGAKTLNGLDMLKIQAEKSWEIWNS